MIELTPIEQGQIVTEPGVYAMPMSWYHDQCVSGVSVSSSGLRTIYTESPADFWCYSKLNPDCLEQPPSDALIFGRAAHSLLLGDEPFAESFAVVPSNAPARPTSAQVRARNAGKPASDSARERFAFWDRFEMEHHGKDFVSENDLLHIEAIAEKLKREPIVDLLLQGAVERSLIWQDRKTGIWLKSRLDVLSDTGDLADLKSTSRKSKALLLRDIRLHGYDMQLGLATIGLEEVMGIPFTAESYASRAAVLVFFHKQPPYHIMPVEVTFDALHWGRLKCRAALDRMADCIRNDDWPGPYSGIIEYTPAAEEAELLALQDAGLFPRIV